MATTTRGKRTTPPKRPEKKFGPFHGGVGIAIWLNQVNDEGNPRYFRSVTIDPRRYRDKETGDWKNGISFRSTDIPALVLALQAAHDYIANTPLPGEPVEDDLFDELAAANEEIPT